MLALIKCVVDVGVSGVGNAAAATNGVREHSFSCLRRLKSYLRATMSQSRLNNEMVLHVHKNLTDKLSLVDIGNNFISGSSHRESLFGKFLQTECEQCA